MRGTIPADTPFEVGEAVMKPLINGWVARWLVDPRLAGWVKKSWEMVTKPIGNDGVQPPLPEKFGDGDEDSELQALVEETAESDGEGEGSDGEGDDLRQPENNLLSCSHEKKSMGACFQLNIAAARAAALGLRPRACSSQVA